VQTEPYHTPVLSGEVLSLLITTKNGIYVDGTLGGGGHADAILGQLDEKGILIGVDADDDAIKFARSRLAGFGQRAILRKGNFKNLVSILSDCSIERIDGMLLDLGVSSHQLDEPLKGFSYRSDAPLDLRLDQTQSFSARDVVNGYGERELSDVLWTYGEEKNSRRIARAIVESRERKAIESTKELAAIIEKLVHDQFLNKTLARVFQAVRIEVNNELENLKLGLEASIEALKPGGRLAVISYHSLEDRIVKDLFRAEAATTDVRQSKFLPPKTLQPRLKVLTRKIVEPTTAEIGRNPRARSAKLRVAERIQA
jgi:16S rRNA (cytosine1402-N4)-methyltransferase